MKKRATIKKMPMRMSFAVVLSLALFSTGISQGRFGSIEGKVFDRDTKAPLAGATVTLVGLSVGASAGMDGEFVIRNVPVGSYSVRFSYVGYEPAIETDVIVKPERSSHVDAGLRVSPLRSGEVEVSPDYFGKSDGSNVSAVNFSYEEIRRAPGAAGDVSRIMKSLPSVAEVNDQSNGLIVRGGSPVENAFYLDNIEIPNINHFPTQGASSGPIGLLNLDFIRDVSFYSGGFPAEYGDRLSSVMDIKLRDGNREKVQTQLDLNFAGFGGLAEGPLFGAKGSWLVSVRRSYLDLLIKAIDVGTAVAPRYGDYQWKGVYDIDRSNRVELLGIWGDDHNNPDAGTAVENDMVYYGNQDHYQSTNGINWRVLWGTSGYSNTSLAFTSESFKDDSYETGSGLPIQSNRSLEQSLKLRNINRLRLSGTNVAQFGFELSRVTAKYDIVYGSYTDALGNPVPGSSLKRDLGAQKVAGFFSLESDLSPFINSSIGLRSDYFSYNRKLDLAPRASLTLHPDEKTSVTASAGVYYQTLPLILLSQNDGNSSLRDLKAVHYIIGMERLLTGSTKLSVDVYEKDYSDFPVDPQQPSLFLIDELYYRYGFFFNHGDLVGGGKARSRGVEVIVQKKMAKDFYGMVSASYSKSGYEANDGVWYDRVYDNRIIFCIEGGYKPGDDWEFSIRWIYAGGPPYTPFDIAASQRLDRGVLDATRINSDRYPAYHSLNVRLDKRFNFSGSDLVFYLSAWNVYNRKNVAQYFWNEVRNEQGTIYQWGILPVFGIEYEF